MIKLFLDFMSNTKIILYDCLDIYKILDELKNILNLDLEYASNEIEINSYVENLDSYLVITKKKQKDNLNQIVLDDFPIKLSKLMEQINLSILKSNFLIKSNIQIGRYLLNVNSREIFYKNDKIKLTEQEVKILLYLKETNKKTKVEHLQRDIWKYNSDLETHTVETHIHRLRKKFLNIFEDKDFIRSSKDGYSIN